MYYMPSEYINKFLIRYLKMLLLRYNPKILRLHFVSKWQRRAITWLIMKIHVKVMVKIHDHVLEAHVTSCTRKTRYLTPFFKCKTRFTSCSVFQASLILTSNNTDYILTYHNALSFHISRLRTVSALIIIKRSFLLTFSQ